MQKDLRNYRKFWNEHYLAILPAILPATSEASSATGDLRKSTARPGETPDPVNDPHLSAPTQLGKKENQFWQSVAVIIENRLSIMALISSFLVQFRSQTDLHIPVIGFFR